MRVPVEPQHRKIYFLLALSLSINILLAVWGYHIAQNLIFLDKVKSVEKYLHPLMIEGVEVKYKGLALAFPVAFERFEDKKALYISALEDIHSAMESLDQKAVIWLKFAEDVGVKGAQAFFFSVQIPVNRNIEQNTRKAFNIINAVMRNSQRCKERVEQLKGSVGVGLKDYGGATINDTDSKTA